jgi:phosphate transport system protein
LVEHTVKTFDRELDALERRIVEMGGIAGKMVIDAMDALANADIMLAHKVVAADLRLDALQREIENMAVTTIARRQPVAADLRELIGTIRIAGDLERVGDLAKNIAKRSVKVRSQAPIPPAIIGLKHMKEVATELLKDVLDAYAQRDEERAREVWVRDVDLDELEDSVFRDLLTYMMEDPRNISFCAHLLFSSKNIERIGDHATNIAETVIYLVSGRSMPSERPHSRRETDARIDIDAAGGDV